MKEVTGAKMRPTPQSSSSSLSPARQVHWKKVISIKQIQPMIMQPIEQIFSLLHEPGWRGSLLACLLLSGTGRVLIIMAYQGR